MKYKFITDSVVAKIDDDGLSRLSCTTDNEDFKEWLAEGNTPEPADVPIPTVQDQIVALEAANPITHRNLRDLAMAVAAMGELVTGQPAANLPMVQTITALEEQIAALRGSL